MPTIMQDGSLEQFTGLEINADNSHVMMCGSSEMITDVSEVLLARGMKKHRRRDPGSSPTAGSNKGSPIKTAHSRNTLISDSVMRAVAPHKISPSKRS